MSVQQKFDGLSDDYDRYRPRYPSGLLRAVADELAPFDEVTAVDTGAGTGIALEGMIPALGGSARHLAVDVSQDMVDRGREKFPEVRWAVGPAEEFLENLREPVQLIVAAQAYQWMDRARYADAALAALVPGGVLAVLQNNRDFSASTFLDAYEELLEKHSPGYSRHYRDFDIEAELGAVFRPSGGRVRTEVERWTRSMGVDDFVRMSSSSTQVQRAVAQEGDVFLQRVKSLCEEYAQDGAVDLPYRSELFLCVKG